MVSLWLESILISSVSDTEELTLWGVVLVGALDGLDLIVTSGVLQISTFLGGDPVGCLVVVVVGSVSVVHILVPEDLNWRSLGLRIVLLLLLLLLTTVVVVLLGLGEGYSEEGDENHSFDHDAPEEFGKKSQKEGRNSPKNGN